MVDRLENIQTRYRDTKVAARYDARRYGDLEGKLNNRAMWNALRRALASVPAHGRLLDVPCGTGRFCWHFARLGYQTVASDISLEMLSVARAAEETGIQSPPRFFQGDIFRLPFTDHRFDAVTCIRLFNLLDRPTRVAALREMARVSNVIIASYYHKYTFKYASRWVRHNLRLRKKPNPRLSRRGLLEEIAEAGLHLHRLIAVAPLLSEAWIAVLTKPNAPHEPA